MTTPEHGLAVELAVTGDGAPGAPDGPAGSAGPAGPPGPDGAASVAPEDARSPAGSGAARLAGWLSRHGVGDTMVVAGVVVLAYLPYLVGMVIPGVFGFNSGLATIPLGPYLGTHVGLPWLDPNVGYVSQALGHLSAVSLLHGHLPWWNPFEGVGAPLAGEGQSAALFPLTPLLALANGQLYFHLILQVVAGVATQRLLREMGLSRWVTIVGGIVFGLNGSFAWLTNAAFNPVAFLPILLWGVERCRRRPFTESRSGWLLVAVGLAGSVYAGFPEVAYLDGLLVAAWALLRWGQQPAGQRSRYAATVGIGAGVGALVSAPFAAAFAAATRHADIGGHANNGFAASHLPSAALNTVGLPYLFGPISGYSAQDPTGALNNVWGNVGGYVTAALLCLALCGLFAGRDRGLRLLLGGWVLVTLTRSFGVGPVTAVLKLVPGIHSISFGRYSPASWEMAALVLACLGLDSFATANKSLRRSRMALRFAGLCTLGVVLLAVFEGRHILHALEHSAGFTRFAVGALLWAVVTVVVLVLLGWFARPRLARAAMGLVLALDALVMFMVPQLSAPTHIPVDMAPVSYLQQHLGLSRFATLGPIVPNYGSMFGIAELNSHDLPTPGPWANYVGAHLETNERPQQFDGVASLDPTGPTPLDELRAHLRAYESVGVRFVVAPTVWGRVVPGRRVFEDRYTSIWKLPTSTPYFRTVAGSCSLHPLSRTEVTATCRTPSVIVRQELDAPGWSASAAGRSLTVAPHGTLFMAVHVPAGTTVVTFNYRPPHIVAAGALAVLGVLLALMAMAVPWWRRRSHPREVRVGRTRFLASSGPSEPGDGGAVTVDGAVGADGDGARRADPSELGAGVSSSPTFRLT